MICPAVTFIRDAILVTSFTVMISDMAKWDLFKR
jgi:hypothetical protein